MLVGIGYAPVVFFLEFVLRSVGGRVAAQPEILNKYVALLVVGELLESLLFFGSNNVANVFIQPFLVGLANLDLQSLRVSLFLLLCKRAFERIYFILFALDLLLIGVLGLGIIVGRLRPNWCGEKKQP